jgi:Ca2+-binding EF-hand superfamily protein
MLKRLILSGLLLAAAAGAAQAQMRPSPSAMFDNADTNHDGSIAREEFYAARGALFPKRDSNSDGFIDDADMPKGLAARPRLSEAVEKMRAQLDLNSDGKITPQEFVDGAMPLFDKADTNGNGALETQEIEAAKAAAKTRIAQKR